MADIRIPIGGMHCQHCSKSVCDALAACPGVASVDVDLAKGLAFIKGDGYDLANLKNVIEKLGFDAGDPI